LEQSQQTYFVFALLFCCSAFSSIVLPSNGSKVALRSLPYTKVLLIAFTFGIVCALLPLNESYLLAEFGWPIFFEKFLFIVAITLPFDIKDLAYDQCDGVVTLPSKIGSAGTVLIALTSLVLSLFVVLTFVQLSPGHIAAYVILYSITAYMILRTLKKPGEYFYLFGLDGLMILLYLLLSLVSIF